MSRPIMHAPKPGPLYWDWRCLVCSEPVADHAPWWRRVFERKPIRSTSTERES